MLYSNVQKISETRRSSQDKNKHANRFHSIFTIDLET